MGGIVGDAGLSKELAKNRHRPDSPSRFIHSEINIEPRSILGQVVDELARIPSWIVLDRPYPNQSRPAVTAKNRADLCRFRLQSFSYNLLAACGSKIANQPLGQSFIVAIAKRIEERNGSALWYFRRRAIVIKHRAIEAMNVKENRRCEQGHRQRDQECGFHRIHPIANSTFRASSQIWLEVSGRRRSRGGSSAAFHTVVTFLGSRYGPLPQSGLPRFEDKMIKAFALMHGGAERHHEYSFSSRVIVSPVDRDDGDRAPSLVRRVGRQFCEPDLAALRIGHVPVPPQSRLGSVPQILPTLAVP